MSFVVDGSEWRFEGMSAADAEMLIDRALEFVSTSSERGETVAVGDDFQVRLMRGGETLWDLFSPGSFDPLDRELSQELAAWLAQGAALRRRAQLGQPASEAVRSRSVAAAPIANDDVEWAHCSMLAALPVAVLTLNEPRVVSTTTDAGTADLHFVADDVSRRAFWRTALVVAGDGLHDLVQFGSRAYPNLHFVPGVLADADSLGGGYLGARARLKSALEILDEWGSWALTWPPPALTPNEGPPPDPAAGPTNFIIEHRFGGLGLEAAPENPNVFADGKSRRAREVVVAGRTLYCEWHVKLELHRNRIHFHPPGCGSRRKGGDRRHPSSSTAAVIFGPRRVSPGGKPELQPMCFRGGTKVV